MTLTFTGIAYIVGSIAIGGLTWRFYQYYMRERSTVSRMFYWFIFFFFLFFLATAAITLFFADSVSALRFNVIIAALLQGIGCAFLGYLVVYMKGGKIPPIVGFLAMLGLGILATILAITIPYEPHISSDGLSIVWDVPLAADWPRVVYFIATFIPLGVIFFSQFFTTKEAEARLRALGLGTVMLFAVLAILIEFLQEVLGLRQIHSDIALTIEYLLVIVLLLLPTAKLASKYLNGKEEPVGTEG